MKKSKYTPDGKIIQQPKAANTRPNPAPKVPHRNNQAAGLPFQPINSANRQQQSQHLAEFNRPADIENRAVRHIPMKQQGHEARQPSVRRKGRKKGSLALRLFLDLLIVLCLAGAIYFYVEPIIRSKNQDREEKRVMSDFDEFLKHNNSDQLLTASLDKNSKPVPGEAYEYEGDGLEVPEPERDADGNIILRYEGRIIMPDTKIETLLASDDSLYALRYSAGHHNVSPKVDENGRTVILGHNFHDRGRVFSRLDEVKVGQKIYIDLLKDRKRYVYDVYHTDKIRASELFDAVEETSKDNEILLVTCGDEYENGAAVYRLLVYGKLKNKIDIPADSKITGSK